MVSSTVRLILPRSWLTLSKKSVNIFQSWRTDFVHSKAKKWHLHQMKFFANLNIPYYWMVLDLHSRTAQFFGKNYFTKIYPPVPGEINFIMEKIAKRSLEECLTQIFEGDEKTCTLNSSSKQFLLIFFFLFTNLMQFWSIKFSFFCSLFAAMREYGGGNNVGISVTAKTSSENDCS